MKQKNIRALIKWERKTYFWKQIQIQLEALKLPEDFSNSKFKAFWSSCPYSHLNHSVPGPKVVLLLSYLILPPPTSIHLYLFPILVHTNVQITNSIFMSQTRAKMDFGSVILLLRGNKKWYNKTMLSQYKIPKTTVICFIPSGVSPYPKFFCKQEMRGKDKIKEKITEQDIQALRYIT